MSDYLLQHGTRQTPQSEPLTPDQVENSAGGFTWQVDMWTRLRRFLILGSEGGTYYIGERDLTKENIDAIRTCLAEDGERTIREIVEISTSGRAPKNDPALYALAVAISDKARPEVRRAAAEALPSVARIATHLYHFVAYAETMRGWGRTMRWAVSNWYQRNPEQLALQAIKYRQRDGWSHRDLLRLAHPKARGPEASALFDWITHGTLVPEGRTESGGPPVVFENVIDPYPLVRAFEAAQRSENAIQTAKLVRENPGLPREALKPEHLTNPEVWHALLENEMPITALVRNLANMTRIGALANRDHLRLVTEALSDQEALTRSRIHPLAILVALRTYAAGRGFRGSNTWNTIPDVLDALDGAFYLAFGNVPSTGLRTLLALDVSGSMGGGNVAGSPLTPREAAAAMALVTLHAEPDCQVMAFAKGFVQLPLSRRQRLDDVVDMTSRLGFDATDCSLPFLYATQVGLNFDTFVVYTDSETWAGEIHPKQALDAYRQTSGIPARSAVVGMVSNGFTIADPNDAGMLDVVGMDTATPGLLTEFALGRV